MGLQWRGASTAASQRNDGSEKRRQRPKGALAVETDVGAYVHEF